MKQERPQDYADLLWLVATLEQADPPDRERRTIRDHLLAKLMAIVAVPTMVQGGIRLA